MSGKTVAPDISGEEKEAFEREMRALLERHGPISPAGRTALDSAVLYGLIAGASTTAMFLSGYFDTLSHGAQADHNYLRMAQASIATLNVLLTAGLSAFGRYQTFRDLADYQNGVNPETIIARAAREGKSATGKAFDWTLKNAFNINAWVSLPLCALMATSGVMSGRPGEAATAALLVPVYLAQLMPERYKNARATQSGEGTAEAGWLRKTFHAAGEGLKTLMDSVPVIRSLPPLALSSLLASWRLVPMAANAVAEKDVFQFSQFALSLLMYVFKANTTKDGIGRLGGSIVDSATPNAAEISRLLLEGRFFGLRGSGSSNAAPAPSTKQP